MGRYAEKKQEKVVERNKKKWSREANPVGCRAKTGISVVEP